MLPLIRCRECDSKLLQLERIWLLADGRRVAHRRCPECGTRDSLMLAIVHRGPRIAVASWAIQIAALSLGFALGGPVGIGTALFALGLGPCIEGAYVLLVRSGVTRPQRRHAPTRRTHGRRAKNCRGHGVHLNTVRS